MKRLLCTFVIFVLIIIGNGCVSTKNTYYKKKTQTVKGKHYSEMRGLMLLDNKQLGRNKYFYSKNNQKKIRSRKK